MMRMMTMNNEIKEILDSKVSYVFTYKDRNELLDYITNLQQENQYLKEQPCFEIEHTDTFAYKKWKCSEVKEQAEKIEELQQENERLKERVAYLERSNNRREDTILGLRQEIYEQEDYKSRCEKAIEYLKECYSQPENIENFMTESEMNYLLNILQNGSDS